MRPLLTMLFVACSSAPKTPATMLAVRRAHGLAYCKRECPVGVTIDPSVDCCVDPNGLTWSSCAWNGAGRFATREQLLAAPLGGCGGPGYPDCAP